MGYIYDDWKKLLEDFQKCVEKDLEEIHQQKAEVQQIKVDIFDKMGEGLFYRDDNRIVISAPEIVIGNVDKGGDLQGYGRIIIKGEEISQEGVGEHGKIISRAPSIRQIAVNPGIDGQENVVCDTSEIVSQATDIVLHSSDSKGAFSQAPLIAGKGGIRIHADNNLQLEAAVSAEGRKRVRDCSDRPTRFLTDGQCDIGIAKPMDKFGGGENRSSQQFANLDHRVINVRRVLHRLERTVDGEHVALLVDLTHKCLKCRRLARLARRVYDEVVAARDEFADARQPVKRRQHIVLVREARSCRIELPHLAFLFKITSR